MRSKNIKSIFAANKIIWLSFDRLFYTYYEIIIYYTKMLVNLKVFLVFLEIRFYLILHWPLTDVPNSTHY